jgi:tRNA threonylcarbamoyladenosine biosynthesis protein TsaE
MLIEFNHITYPESADVAKAIINHLPVSNIVVFEGPVGSGKTSLISILCKLFGVKETVSSPSYGLVNEYCGSEDKIIYHFDFYRLLSIDEAFDIGIEEYLYSGNLCLIEWADIINPLLPKEYLKVSISVQDNTRNYCLEQI